MDNKISYNDLTGKIYNFLYDEVDSEDYIKMNELILAEKFCNIILENFEFSKFVDNPKFKKSISKDRTIKYSKNFLEFLKKDYGIKLIKNIDDGNLSFLDSDYPSLASVRIENGKNVIRVPLKYDMSDTFILTHEQIHDTVLSLNNFTISWSYFSEVPTMLAELLQADYMKDNNISLKELLKYQKYSLSAYAVRALNLKASIELMKEVLTNGFISKITIYSLIEKLSRYCPDYELCLDAIDKSINDLYNSDEIFYFFDLRYIIGGVLSSYLYEIINKKPSLIKEYSEYNEFFSKLDIQGVFESLGLDFCEDQTVDLTEESYKNLEGSYKKLLKRIW